MAKRYLQILSQAYRANLEEQDDPVVWITHAIRGAGGDQALLLEGSATNYAVVGQDARGLSFGALSQAHPPDVAGEVARLLGKGVPVFVVEEDATERGLAPGDFIPGVKPIPRPSLPSLLDGYDHVWQW